MLKVEKKLMEWIQEHMILLAFVVVTIFGLLIRYTLREMESVDSVECLLPWYDIIKSGGGLTALKEQVGNYNMLYQFLIAVLTYLPIKALYGYKLLSCIFDFLLAGLLSRIVYELSNKNREYKALVAYGIVLVSPVIFLNSSAWAQCDAIYTFFSIAALYACVKEKYIPGFILVGVAFSFKLQAVFILPVILFIYFVKKKFSVIYFGIIPVVMFVLSLPAIIMGRPVLDIIDIYLGQTDTYLNMNVNYPSFWTLINNHNTNQYYFDMKRAAMFVTVTILAFMMIGWIIKKIELNARNLFYMAFLLAYTCVLFLPAMHERYGYLYEALAIVIVFLEIKTAPLLVALNAITLSTYGFFFYYNVINESVLSVANLATYVLYMILLNYRMVSYMRKTQSIISEEGK